MSQISGTLGRIAAITRFPVKSMAGERLEEAEFDWQGLEGDRQYAFVKRGDRSRFPWLTGRDVSAMVLCRARYADPAAPRTAAVTVSTPAGDWPFDHPALSDWLEEQFGRPIDLIQLGIGAYDAMPVSVLTTATLAALERKHGSPLDPRRFRANIVVESDAREGNWAGHRLRLGGEENAAELQMAGLAPRCAMVTIDPDTAVRDAGVLRTVAQAFDNRVACYASIARPGLARIGDEVLLT
ncbi:MOSC domain-containing protein [Sphingomonas sp.]|jgi:hypothetical protein|uniref:MOSC domain-containing protein n=1 Tax=Sphingomonas sp. TaxID=28214 RepID=UPI002D80C451|nr:MOSC N-terminal beta barrel domain-containing protein [Sphingomonas sp.]HEU0045912.1 MOSC N-terminal beta barrel domain-containing protein [Sphingomonas sp.]